MSSHVFFGSARQARLEARETLPAKLDLILERLRARDRGPRGRSRRHTEDPERNAVDMPGSAAAVGI